MRRLFRIFSHRHITADLLIIFILLAFSLFHTTSVQGNWLQKGLDLLKGSGTGSEGSLTVDEIGLGLKEALRVGSETVVTQLGRRDGFNRDPAVHIPLPRQLANAKDWLGRVGMASLLDDLELKLNRAAEEATPKAKELFFQAIREMTLEDVKSIYDGPDDAATRYFQGKMATPLAGEMRPIVSESLSHVGAIKSYDNAMKEYRAIPFAPDVKADLTDYVVEKGIAGIFHYLAVEEAAIRRNPAKRTTELLQKVFGQK